MTVAPAIRDAATVALLRDGDRGLEVLLLRRAASLVFGANAHVFPGGALDASDASLNLAARCQRSAGSAPDQFGETGRTLAYWMAAIREGFEEAGVLLGCAPDRLPDAQTLAAERQALNAGERDWPSVVERLDLQFRLDALVYFAHWLTPPGQPKRYATRFFVTRAPIDQAISCDGHEITQAWWSRPADALNRRARGEIKLMRPTHVTLRTLCDYADVDSALAGLASAGAASA